MWSMYFYCSLLKNLSFHLISQPRLLVPLNYCITIIISHRAAGVLCKNKLRVSTKNGKCESLVTHHPTQNLVKYSQHNGQMSWSTKVWTKLACHPRQKWKKTTDFTHPLKPNVGQFKGRVYHKISINTVTSHFFYRSHVNGEQKKIATACNCTPISMLVPNRIVQMPETRYCATIKISMSYRTCTAIVLWYWTIFFSKLLITVYKNFRRHYHQNTVTADMIKNKQCFFWALLTKYTAKRRQRTAACNKK